MVNDGMFSSERGDWATPQATFDYWNSVFCFELDVCASEGNAKCEAYFNEAFDGLSQVWDGRCWMNPPYGRSIGKWTTKARESASRGTLVVGLLPARTDTQWWHRDVEGSAIIVFLKGRLKFGGSKQGAPFPSAIAIWLPSSEAVR